MSVLKTKQIIYELDEEDVIIAKKGQRSSIKSLVLDRKLGIATYEKWGAVYNYHFSFDLNKGRLICYKTAKSKHPNNYYTLIQGQFVEDDEEVSKKEKIFQKKKNYIAPPSLDDHQRSVVYVKTKKGKTFRLFLNEGESHDKVMGYLQMCFSSKLKTEAKAFFAMLGVGVIKVNERGYTLNTGILVSLDNWDSGVKSEKNYLVKRDEDKDSVMKIGQLVNNIPVIGAIVSAFQSSTLSLIFNPGSQTVDIILFDNERQPSQFLYQIFLLVKKQKNLQNLQTIQSCNNNIINSQQTLQLIKLKSCLYEENETFEYIQIGENKSVQIMCKKCYIPMINQDIIQSSMFAAAIDEDQHENQSDETDVVAQALNFYKKALLYYPQNGQESNTDDTKEFILVNSYQRKADFMNQMSPIRVDFDQMPKKAESPDLVSAKEYYIPDENSTNQIQQPLIQETKLINIQMQRNKSGLSSPFLYPSTPISKRTSGESEFNQRAASLSDNVKSKHHIDQSSQNSSNQTPQIQIQYYSPQSDAVLQELEEQDDGEVEVNKNEDEEGTITKAGKVDYPTSQVKGYRNIMKYAQDFQFPTQTDEYRVAIANKSGGTACLDKNIVNLSRSVGKTMIKEIGRKIISGNFNLTTISFPIIAMIPRSGLEKMFMQTILFPLYMNRACQTQDPIERLKLLMVALIGNFIQANSFLKPLNPIIGETFEGSYDDGSLLYAEQISHHPPVSYFLTVGPQSSYKFWGYYLYEAKAGLNSLVLNNKGKRFVEFQDGQKISMDFSQEQYSGTFMGTIKHESIGTIVYKDERNGLTATMNFGKVKKRPTDFVDGEIKQGNKLISKLYGSYLGFLEWDGLRYWDARHVLPFKQKVEQSLLESDHTRRIDRLLMLNGDMKQAQIKKDSLESFQRTDAKLRKEYENQILLQEKADKKKKKK